MKRVAVNCSGRIGRNFREYPERRPDSEIVAVDVDLVGRLR
jgi:glyceraldehyde-3-phosphate dehydrogenase/erythrose-4-phosphate dehydrogenase